MAAIDLNLAGAAAAPPHKSHPALGAMRVAVAIALGQTKYDPLSRLQMRVILLLDAWDDEEKGERVRQRFYEVFGQPKEPHPQKTTSRFSYVPYDEEPCAPKESHPSLNDYRVERMCSGDVDFIRLFYAYLNLHYLKCKKSASYRKEWARDPSGRAQGGADRAEEGAAPLARWRAKRGGERAHSGSSTQRS